VPLQKQKENLEIVDKTFIIAPSEKNG